MANLVHAWQRIRFENRLLLSGLTIGLPGTGLAIALIWWSSLGTSTRWTLTVLLVALWLSYAFTGALLVETVFSWPGMGLLMWESAMSRDYPMLMGIFTISSILIYGIQWLTDILYAWLDPRIHY